MNKAIVVFFLCIASVANATVRGTKRFRLQADSSSSVGSPSIESVKQRYLMEDKIDGDEEEAELPALSMSLSSTSMSMSMSTPPEGRVEPEELEGRKEGSKGDKKKSKKPKKEKTPKAPKAKEEMADARLDDSSISMSMSASMSMSMITSMSMSMSML